MIALAAILLGLAAAAFYLGRRRALVQAEGVPWRLHSLPGHYGGYVALWTAGPALAALAAWWWVAPRVIEALVRASLPPEAQALPPLFLERLLSDARALAEGQRAIGAVTPALEVAAQRWASLAATARAVAWALVLGVGSAGLAFGLSRVHPEQRARDAVEGVLRRVLFVSSTLAILVTIGIVLSLLFEALRFFDRVPPSEFLFGLQWSPQTALRADQVGSSGAFGAVPVFAGTLLITVIAMAVATPVGLFSAIYLAEYAHARARAVAKPLLEILAGIPTVVYGFFAALTVGPGLRALGERVGLSVASESALAAGLVMGVMIIPFVSSLSDDAINAVPRALREGALGLGATRSEVVRTVLLPAALPGIVAAVLLAISRAIGETMIVVMAAGLTANLTANPFEAVTTVTVQIVTLLTGDQEFDSAKTLAAFALGLVLFVATLLLNVVALYVSRRYRERYE